MKKLSDKLPEKLFIISAGDKVPIPSNFLTQSADLFESNKNFRGSILVVLLEALVCTYTVGRKNPLIEDIAKTLYLGLTLLALLHVMQLLQILMGRHLNSGCRYSMIRNVLGLQIFTTVKYQTLLLAWKLLSTSGKLTANIEYRFYWQSTKPRWLRG